MPLNRREFIVTSSLAATAGALRPASLFGQQAPAQAPAAPVVPTFEAVRGNVGTFTARGGTMGWYIAPTACCHRQSPRTRAQMFLDGLKPRPRKIDIFSTRIITATILAATRPGRLYQDGGARERTGLQKKQAAAAKSEDAQAHPDETQGPGGQRGQGLSRPATTDSGTPAATSPCLRVANVVHMGFDVATAPRVDRPSGASIKNWIVLLDRSPRLRRRYRLHLRHAKVDAGEGLARRPARSGTTTAVLDYVQKGFQQASPRRMRRRCHHCPPRSRIQREPDGYLQMAYEVDRA